MNERNMSLIYCIAIIVLIAINFGILDSRLIGKTDEIIRQQKQLRYEMQLNTDKVMKLEEAVVEANENLMGITLERIK